MGRGSAALPGIAPLHETHHTAAARRLTAAAWPKSKAASNVTDIVTFPFCPLWLQLTHEAMAWLGYSSLLFLGVLMVNLI